MTPNLEELRRERQRALAASGHEIEIGSPAVAPLPLDELAALTSEHPCVREVHDSGLTAIVYRLHAQGRDWAVKRARPECLVQNIDGQTSFLNEVQRRAELAALPPCPGLTPTVYASVQRGLVVSPWITGGQRVHDWTERCLLQVFDTGRHLVRRGFFEWDFCPGNVLNDGQQVWLFDFGYMYRFDPLQHFNSAGNGLDVPQCHLAERIETRHVFGWLLKLEQDQGMAAALQAFRLEKRVALDCYRQLRSELASDGASAAVLAWLDSLQREWQAGLSGDLGPLYLKEGWRSHAADLEDDLHGQTCTPTTLLRAQWLLTVLREQFDALRAQEALQGDEARAGRDELIARYEGKVALARRYQVAPGAAPASALA